MREHRQRYVSFLSRQRKACFYAVEMGNGEIDRTVFTFLNFSTTHYGVDDGEVHISKVICYAPNPALTRDNTYGVIFYTTTFK